MILYLCIDLLTLLLSINSLLLLFVPLLLVLLSFATSHLILLFFGLLYVLLCSQVLLIYHFEGLLCLLLLLFLDLFISAILDLGEILRELDKGILFHIEFV